jgi:hypothetical protein
LPRGLLGWDQLCTSLDQLLVNVLLGRVFTILRQFDYAFLLRRPVGCLFFLRQWCIVAMIVGATPMCIGKICCNFSVCVSCGAF